MKEGVENLPDTGVFKGKQNIQEVVKVHRLSKTACEKIIIKIRS